MVSCRTTRPSCPSDAARTCDPPALRSLMIGALASNTMRPSYGGTCEVNRPPASSGCTTSMPLAVESSMSSSPKAGARWTIPVPLSVVT
ncbi:Uncharacterised protein [Mycobacteroides abscessus subsp. abscessus]|nr:Uncharacterised protein [Mycobacteroides abscessus subsp. abscessus]